MGGVGPARLHVLSGQVGRIGENVRHAHPAGEVVQHIADNEAQASDAGLAAALARLDGDSLAVLLTVSLLRLFPAAKRTAKPPSPA